MPRRRKGAIKRSGFEDDIAKDLDARGINYGWETETFLHLRRIVNGIVMCPKGKAAPMQCHAYQAKKYKPDFVIPRDIVGTLYIEAKGRFPASDRTKLLAVREYNPDIDLRLLFYRKEKLRPALKTMKYNTDWAEHHGFQYAIGHEVPEEWL